MRQEKIQRLNKAREVLKQEFIGLDPIIDRIIECVSPWYLTPELIERPVVISLFGLTGTGKTSLVKRLFNLLDVIGKSVLVDCGETTTGDLFSSKLSNMFDSRVSEGDPRYTQEELDKFEVDITGSEGIDKTDPLDFAFILDEFQYLKTKDEDEKEIDRPESRAIWTLIDSGIIDINYGSKTISSLLDYVDDLRMLELSKPGGVKLSNGRFPKELSKELSTTIQYHRWLGDEDEESEGTSGKTGGGHPLLDKYDTSFLVKRLNTIRKGLGFKFMSLCESSTRLDTFVPIFGEYVELIAKPRLINCSKALIFVLGNLDEAFNLTGADMDPDIDADVYHEMTSKVNIMGIKRALRKRFRDEQIGRLGNNIIIYPSLRKEDFREIINKELSRISSKFEPLAEVKVEFTDSLKDLIYKEGVYPIQGVRPIYTTINSLINPRLSEIFMEEKPGVNRVVLDTAKGQFSLDRKIVPIIIQYFKETGELYKEVTKSIRTTLGSLRDPERCKKLAIQGIHEASHAVAYSKLTGEFPSAIVAGAISGGGYMMESVKSDDISSLSIREFEQRVLISLAGYYGERFFFDEKECTLGASSDIANCWGEVSRAFGKCGYIEPILYGDNKNNVETRSLPEGLPWKDIEGNLRGFLIESCLETKKLIKKESKLILEIGKYLSENRCMSIEVYKEMIDKYAETFNIASMTQTRKDNDNYYKSHLYER